MRILWSENFRGFRVLGFWDLGVLGWGLRFRDSVECNYINRGVHRVSVRVRIRIRVRVRPLVL